MAVHFVLSIGAKIGEYLIVPIGRQLGYLIYYKSNLKSLRNEVKKVEERRGVMQHSVDAAKRNGECIETDVEGWLTRVDEHNKVAKSILENETEAKKRCLNWFWCPNMKLRYSLSRKAKKNTEEAATLLSEGNFTKVSYRPALQGIEARSTQGIMGFDSRRQIMKRVIETLKDDSVNMIGICGMGGVGKTTLVKAIAKRAKEEKLFDEVVISVVSQSPDEKKIQGEIADMLGLEFDEESASGRASRLHARLSSIQKILVILDDVWKRIELSDIGIPFGDAHKGCKILLTSRNEEVCDDMGAQTKFPVEVLPKEEAWNLFKEMARITDDATNLHSTQMAVANECRGLPIAIVTVGRALNGKGDESSWNSALEQLRKSIGKNIRGVEKDVFKLLEWSYNYLESEEAKKCFLLCSLFPEDSNIPIEDIVRYGICLDFFESIDSIGQARDRVYGYVGILKKCYLLLDSNEEECVKIHDVIRDVAISIASRENNSFIVRCNEELKDWPENDRHTNNAVISMRCIGVPNNLVFPKLQLLRIQSNLDIFQEFPESFFEGMKELKVLALLEMSIRSLPASLRCLTNLRTLSLFFSRLTKIDLSIIGALENLKILSFVGLEIDELPEEMGNLTHLKILDLLNSDVGRVPPGILSRLSKLEELYLGKIFQKWYHAEDRIDEGNALITELESLPNLVSLSVSLPRIEYWPRDLVLEKVKTFDIALMRTPPTNSQVCNYLLPNKLKLSELDISGLMLAAWLKMLWKSAKLLDLRSIAGLTNIVSDFFDLEEVCFRNLIKLSIDYCKDLECLVNTADHGQLTRKVFTALEDLKLWTLPKLTHLWKGPTQLVWLCNLRSVHVGNCKNLEFVFSIYIARNLVQLEQLDIRFSDKMEVIVSSEGAGEHEIEATTAANKIEFPKLTQLHLTFLPSLTTICRAVDIAIVLPRLNELELLNIPKLNCLCLASGSEYNTTVQPLFHNKDTLTSIETLKVYKMHNLIEIWPRDLKAKLRILRVSNCAKLPSILLPSNLIECMQNLELLLLRDCETVDVAFDLGALNAGEDHGPARALPSLEDLELNSLPNLTRVWANYSPGIQGFENLRSLVVCRCGSLRILFSPFIAKLLVKLEELDVGNCDVMKAIIAWEQEVDDEGMRNTIIFPQLNSVKFRDLRNLTSTFYSQTCMFGGSFLKRLKLNNIPKLIGLCPASESNFDTTIHSLFNNKDTLTSIEEMEVSSMDNLIEIWPRDLKAKLRVLRVSNCAKLPSILLPSNLIECMQNLELLLLRDCETVDVAFDLGALNAGEDHGPVRALPSLKDLELNSLPNLTRVWANYSPGIQGFQNLRSLVVYRCGSLRILFSTFIAKLLVKLEELNVGNCDVMKAIIAWEQEVDDEGMRNTIIFPQLNSVKFRDLRNLTSTFYSQTCMFGGSFLKRLKLNNIPKLIGLCPASESNFDTTIHSLFNNKDTLTRIEVMEVSEMDNLIEIWPRDLKAKLRAMTVNKCPKLTSILLQSNLKCMQNLKELIVGECESVKVAFDFGALNADEDHGTARALPSLDNLRLYWLPNLMHVWANYSPGIQGFQNLRSLEVYRCHSLRILFSPFIAKLLVKLEQLEIGYCDVMEAVIARELEVDDEGMRNTIIFPQLIEVKLKDLPKLMSFCPQAYTIEGKFLKTVEVVNCPETMVLPSAFQLMQKAIKDEFWIP
ncbi:disease resistance protein At4g27190-like isoform X2 [Actinidia eriantha]|nr:disease resistance protein At4g27190-like isoform X2 [Actinidia eriantha]